MRLFVTSLLLLIATSLKAQIAIVGFENGPADSVHCPQTEVSLEFESSSGDSAILNWGDGTVLYYSYIPDPRQHAYDTSGVYYIVLTVFLNGTPAYDTLRVTILPASFARFGTNRDTICAGDVIIFSDSTDGLVTSYLWNFDDQGSTNNTSSSPNPTHQYKLPGTYSPKLTVYDGTCTTTYTKEVIVEEDTSLINFTYSSSPCPCNNIQFISTGNANSWQWNFGDNASASNTSTLQNPTHSYTEPGTYVVTLTGTDASGICTETNTFPITVCGAEIDSSISLSNNHWYFGDSAALSFFTFPPTPLGNNALNNFQGGSTISDPYTGNLLFYTNGIEVYNASHQLVKNGSGLTTNGSSAQGSLIVPYPGDPNRYYIFVSPANSWHQGYRYSIIDIAQDSLVVKNQLLAGGSIGFEQLSGVTKTYESDCAPAEYWVVFPTSSSNFRCIPITSSGIGAPVNNNFNWAFGNNVGVTEIAFSHDRKKMAVYGKGGMWVFDFNINTGVLSNPFIIPGVSGGGLCFSENNRFLYCTGWSGNIYQIDLFASNVYQNISRFPNQLGSRGTMWYRLDDKIYISTGGFRIDSIAVVNNPNLKYPACNYQAFGQYVGPGRSSAGLQNIVPFHVSRFLIDSVKADFVRTGAGCLGDTVSFQNNSTIPPPKDPCAFYQNDTVDYHWDFGDGSTSTLSSPTHLYSSAGIYTVELIVNRPFVCLSDTFYQTLSIAAPSSNTLTPTICQGNTYLSPSGKILSITSTYLDTIPNTGGCDSLITINLQVDSIGLNSQSITQCDSANVNGVWYYTSQLIADTLTGQAASGCDSIIATNLTINLPSTNTLTASICPGQSYLSPSGKSYTTTGNYLDTIPNSIGCDSLITITIGPSPPVVNNIALNNNCDSVEVNGIWYYSTTVVYDTITGGGFNWL